MLRLLFIVLGGGLGTLLRYAVSGLTYRYFDGIFPWGTLSVNLIGSFFVGFLWEIFDRFTFSSGLKMFVFVGVVGGFTTFSTYALESVNLWREGESLFALINIVFSNVFGLCLVIVGVVFSRLLLNWIQ